MKILVAYNGSFNSKTALRQAIFTAREYRGMVTVLHVFHSQLFIDYEAGPGAEVLARGESSRCITEVKEILKKEGTGIWWKVVFEEGNPAEEIVRFAREENVDMIFSPPPYKTISRGLSCPVCIVPSAPQFAAAEI